MCQSRCRNDIDDLMSGYQLLQSFARNAIAQFLSATMGSHNDR